MNTTQPEHALAGIELEDALLVGKIAFAIDEAVTKVGADLAIPTGRLHRLAVRAAVIDLGGSIVTNREFDADSEDLETVCRWLGHAVRNMSRAVEDRAAQAH